MKPRKPMARKAPKVKGPSLNHPDRAPEEKKTTYRQRQRARLKPLSQKRKGLLDAYKALKKERGAGPFPCIVCGKPVKIGENGSWHHPRGRRTLSAILDIVPAHEVPCHRNIHARPGEALEKGWLHPEFFRSGKEGA